MPLFEVIELPFCKVLMVGRWNDPPHRYFLSYRTLGAFRHAIGLPVTDEFATFSTPIFFCTAPILGKIYNVGITLGHQRSPDMDIDSGWPPVCIGLAGEGPQLPEQWDTQLLDAIKKAEGPGSNGNQKKELQTQRVQIGECDIFATNAPLLPKQLKRLCQLSNSAISLAFSTGNRIVRAAKGEPQAVDLASEKLLTSIINQFH